MDLEDECEVGLSSISLPHELLLLPYLEALSDDAFMMRTKQVVYSTTSKTIDTLTMDVYYRNIKNWRMETAYQAFTWKRTNAI